MGNSERQLAPLTALMRFQHSVELAFNPPSTEGEVRGCAKYTGVLGNGTFILAQYSDCVWNRTIPAAKVTQVYQLTGGEIFERFTEKPATCTVTGDSFETATATIDVALPRPAKGRQSVLVTKLSQVICMANRAGKVKAVQARAFWGNSSVVQVANWTAEVKSSIWNQLADGSVVLAADAELNWSYRPASNSKSATLPYTAILKSTSPIGFASKCPWPISGSAQLIEIDPNNNSKSLMLTFNATGYRASDGTVTNWPTDHCAGI